MSEKTVNTIYDETKAKLNGFAMLYFYHLSNLCIKADPLALLSVTVEVNGVSHNIEDVAQAGLSDDYTFIVVPKSQEYLFPICKAIKLEHPEFQMEEKVSHNELTGEEEIAVQYVMPLVNEDRRDVCMDYIQSRYDFVLPKMDAVFSAGTAKITAKMIGASAEQLDAVKEKLQEVYNYYKDMCNKFRDDKIQEVEEAFQKYLAEQMEEKKQAEEKQAAEGGQNIFSMNMNDEEE